ncbi:uracil phosphoribosyltransferase-domain-containing protein [Sordaria brevicollis]|uniref:Uracil phosphoribosyltransferase-domain-containing protein n=1 Tax=Sordaria brevicollis TaxID=83679 RepID=A0AAE0P2X4_SORBR|nr:uracil phosphoribosyltransferase-domain-containing protein [Sordaria brevicollis]
MIRAWECLERYLTLPRPLLWLMPHLPLPSSPQRPSNSVSFHAISIPTLNPPTMSSQADKSPMTASVETPTAPKRTVLGIYGLPGSGKSHFLGRFKNAFPSQCFVIYEGSEVIASLMGPGRGLEDFHALTQEEKTHYRERAIIKIREECQKTYRSGVVAGHYMFWPKDNEQGTVVWTKADQETFTHIIYLQVPAETLFQRRERDTVRKRERVAPEHLHKWQQAEMQQLGDIAKRCGIEFAVLDDSAKTINGLSLDRDVPSILHEFHSDSQEYNRTRVLATVDEIVTNVKARKGTRVTTVMVFDADKTLTAQDTGKEFWGRVSHPRQGLFLGRPSPVEEIFGECGYTHSAFVKAGYAYGGVDSGDFEEICNAVAEEVTLYPEFLSLLRRIRQNEHMMAVVVTCGLRRLWEIVLEKLPEDLGKNIKVIGNGSATDMLVITPESKKDIVNRLRDSPHNLHVVAFGDSPLDLPMLLAADQGVVVVGEEMARSKSMEDELIKLPRPLNLYQTLIPRTVTPRLDTTVLPVVNLLDPTDPFLLSLFPPNRSLPPNLLHATDRPSAQLMTTPTRDATISGPTLREAHQRIGWYLATEFITTLVGLEEFSIPHVQGHSTVGHRLLHEKDTTIVALMRGGEPMAFGVNEAFPLAMFLHAKNPEDVKPQHLANQHTIILVDSVVNNGKTVLEFRERIRGLDEGKGIRIVVVAGVVQREAMGAGHELGRVLRRDDRLHIVALRLSDNKFTGRGGTDTGNRLFGTTRLD